MDLWFIWDLRVSSFILEDIRILGFRLDQNEYGGSILVYVRQDFPSKLISVKNCSTEVFFMQLNVGKKEMAIKLHL